MGAPSEAHQPLSRGCGSLGGRALGAGQGSGCIHLSLSFFQTKRWKRKLQLAIIAGRLGPVEGAGAMRRLPGSTGGIQLATVTPPGLASLLRGGPGL